MLDTTVERRSILATKYPEVNSFASGTSYFLSHTRFVVLRKVGLEFDVSFLTVVYFCSRR